MKPSYQLEDLEVYRLAVELSDLAWGLYSSLHWTKQKHVGDQYLRAMDSVGANIAESYGLYHFLNRIRHLYISRGSLKEASVFWLDVMYKRDYISKEYHSLVRKKSQQLDYRLNNYIQKLKREAAKRQ